MDIFYVVPQRSRLGPLLFNIHLCELLYFLEELDIDTTIYTVNEKKSHSALSLSLYPLPHHSVPSLDLD